MFHICLLSFIIVFFFNDTATTEIYTLSLHDALPISLAAAGENRRPPSRPLPRRARSRRHPHGAAGGRRPANRSRRRRAARASLAARLRALTSNKTSSRSRFRPLHRVTFRFRVRPLGGASSYLRSVLDVA